MKSKRKYIFPVLLFLIALFLFFGFTGANFASAQSTQPPGSPPAGTPPPPPGSSPPPPGSTGCPPGQGRIDGQCQLINPASGQLVDIRDFGPLLQRIITIFLYFAGGIAVLFLMVGGFQYVAARGNEEATEKAKKTITGAIIGIIIIVMAFAIVAIVNNLLTRNDIGGGTTGGGARDGTLQAGENCEADSECANNLVCIPTSPSGPKVCQ